MGRSKPDDVKVTTSGGLSVIGEIIPGHRGGGG